MKPFPSLPNCALLCLSLYAASIETPPLWAAEAKPLFDGKTLSGWSGDTGTWHVEDGAMTGENQGAAAPAGDEMIFWKDEVGDFDLEAEFRMSGERGTGAGIQYRSNPPETGEARGYQAALPEGTLKLAGRDAQGKGAIVVEPGYRMSVAPDGRSWKDGSADPKSLAQVVKPNAWNRCHLTVTASHTELRINHALCSALDDHDAKAASFSGRLAFYLQRGKGPTKIEWRNIQLTPLGKTAKPEYPGVKEAAQPEEPAGFKPIGEDQKPLNLDFETGTLEGWKVEGNAWEKQPIEGDATAKRNHGPSNHQGRFWIGGYEVVGDEGTGTLTSTSFAVTHPWASFLIGGGSDPTQTRVEVVEAAGGKVLQTASGKNAESMERVAVDLRGFLGKRIFVRLVDASRAGWGHINFDDFLFHDAPPTVKAIQAATAAIGNERSARQKESPVLWHLLPNPAKPSGVANAEAQRAVASMMLTQGFQAELIAAEPEVRQPIAFAFDERGRIWVAEAYSYPKKQPEGMGTDRILIFEDEKGDGTFQKRTVFYEGLNLVSGLEVGFGGVWVGAAPQLLFIPRDAADHAGKPEVLLDGWGYQDTHETLNSFTWGPDGWLYGNQGVFTNSAIGKPGTPEAERIHLNAGVWRYHPIRREFEIFAHGGSNQWGLDYNSAGHLFMTHCRSFWGRGGTTNVIRNGHFWNQANGGYGPAISATAPDFAPALQNYLPAAARYDSGEGGAGKPGTTAVYGGHSHVGTMIYLGDNWPEIYRDHLFTNNLFGHQMNQQHNVRQGSGYETLHAGYDILFTPDPRYLAVDLQTGPDGAVYLIDWCDLQQCHNPDPDKWDRTNGRIYRVSWAETYHPVKVDLGSKSDVELAQLHRHHNDWYSRAARGLLQERATSRPVDPQAIAILKEQVAGSDVPQALRALWTLHVIGALDTEQLEALTKNPSDLVRGWAVQLATERAGKTLVSEETLMRLAKNDPSPSVRLAIASALPMLDTPRVWEIATALAAHGEDKDDRFLPKMIWFGLARVAAEDVPRALSLAATTPLPSLTDSIRWFTAGNAKGRELMVRQSLNEPEETAARGMRLLAFATKDEAVAPMPAAWKEAAARFENTKDAALRSAVQQLGALFGDKAILATMRGILADETQPTAQRQFAFDLLKRSNDPEATPIFARLLDTDAFRSSVIPLLSRSSDTRIAQALMERFQKFDAVDRAAALGALTSRPELALPLLRSIEAGAFDRKYLSALQVRQLRSLNNAEVNVLVDKGWGKAGESSGAMKATMARLKKAYGEAPLWAFSEKAGHETFNQICAVCHPFNGAGGKLGPDLGGSWRNGVDYFIENIVDPDAVVGENYQLHVLTKKDGTVVSGLFEQESDTAITLRTVTETVVVAKADIKEHQKLAHSLMPPGLLEALPEQKTIELLKFLTSKP